MKYFLLKSLGLIIGWIGGKTLKRYLDKQEAKTCLLSSYLQIAR